MPKMNVDVMKNILRNRPGSSEEAQLSIKVQEE